MPAPTVMIVEDEIILAMELEEKLTEMGYFVVARAASGEEALEKATDQRPELILMDIRLDGEVDGIEAARLISKQHHIPVVYLTAYADEKTLQRAKVTEPFGYLIKPYSERELRITLEMALHKSEMEKQLRESEERFRAVFESAEDLIFLKDRSLRYTDVNPAMLKLLNAPIREVLGKSDDELLGPEEAGSSREVEYRVLGGETVELEHRLSIGVSTITCNFVRVPLRDAFGHITGLCGIGRDITERKDREIQLTSDGEPASFDQYPSSAMRKTLREVRLAAQVDSICLFLGESGSGKDYLARYLHRHSPRSKGPFFWINCAALSPELAESELFGHEKGAFTGAVGRKRGLLELAEGGTLLLNEIGDLPARLQSKLLTFLDTKSFTRVGAEKNIKVNARLVAATNRDLGENVQAGVFRRDLFYRLSVVTIRVPPLRDRMEDLSLLVESLLGSLARRFGLRERPIVEPQAMEKLAAYNWPGNIRELRNVLERGLMHSDRRRISADQIILDSGVSIPETESELAAVVRLEKDLSLPDAINEAKRGLVLEGLRRSGGNVKQAAKLLGISRDSLNYLLKSLGIRRE